MWQHSLWTLVDETKFAQETDKPGILELAHQGRLEAVVVVQSRIELICHSPSEQADELISILLLMRLLQKPHDHRFELGRVDSRDLFERARHVGARGRVVASDTEHEFSEVQ